MSVVNKVKNLFSKGQKAAAKAADVNKDGKVNAKDAKAAKDKAVKTASKAAKNVKKAVKK